MTTSSLASAPLTNVQIELLKLYSTNLSEAEILELRRLLARHFMQKAIDGATRVWEEKGMTEVSIFNQTA